MIKLYHIRKNLSYLDKEIKNRKNRGYKNDPIILSINIILNQMLKEIEQLNKPEIK